MATIIRSYKDLQDYMNALFTRLVSASTGNTAQEDAERSSPHGAFWNTLSYEEFVTGNVPRVPDPSTGNAMPILVKGSSSQSNLIRALRGAAGTPFDPDSGAFGQMPADGPPFADDADIQPIADWIDAGCPEK